MIPFLHFGPITLPTFGLMVATAMLCAYFLLRADLRRRGIDAEAETLVAVPSIAGMIGAKLYHVFESPREFFANPLGELFSSYGFAWFGGLIAGIGAFVYLGRKYKIPILRLFLHARWAMELDESDACCPETATTGCRLLCRGA
jgi:phosphatidylglycerol:prolipoprotein diacylglycerol transferase